MDIDELRRLIRAAVLAAPLAGCGAAAAEAEEPEPITLAPQETTTTGQPTTAPHEPDRVLTEEEWRQRWSSTGVEEPDYDVEVIEGRPLLGAAGLGLAKARGASMLGAVAAHWRDAALREHASIASFARATIELMEVGAPLSLLEAHQRAGADEAVHTRLCFEQAARFSGSPSAAGPLAVPPARAASMERLARDVYREGCLNETIAAWLANCALERCEDPGVRSVLERIATDEAGHSALAWQTLAWLVSAEPVAVRRVLDAERGRIPVLATSSSDGSASSDGSLSGYGILDGVTRSRQARSAYEQLVAPMLEELLGAGHC